jgi:predicted ATPase/class 3 adenylate cyclase
MSQSGPDFARNHVAELVFDRVEHEGTIAMFYGIAGQSLLKYRPLSNYEGQSQLKTIFRETNKVLLTEWNSAHAFAQGVHPQKVLEKWLGFRLNAGGNIEHFLQDTCHVNPDIAGLLIRGGVFPNPLSYARKPEQWGGSRSIDIATGFMHGDLNTNNILVKFSGDKEALEGYYLIDFALFKDQMPLLYDQRYLEMSYLTQAMSQISFAKCVDFLTLMAEADIPDPRKVPVEVSGVSAVIGSSRSAFSKWVQANHPTLHDDLWGQYWLAGVAAGLSYCHKHVLSAEQRLAGLIYASANLKRYAATFNLPLPTKVELLYDESQVGSAKPAGVSTVEAAKRDIPSGTVTFLYTDIEGSTRLSQQYSEAMPALLARHHEILDQAITAHAGYTFQTVGDSFGAAFHSASDALQAALDIQRALDKEAWSPAPIKVRMGIHTGAAQLEAGSKSPGYSGYATIATSQRIMSAGHGGQILLSQIAADLISYELSTEVDLRDMGQWRLKDVMQPVHLYQASVSGLPSDFPPLNAPEVVNHNLPTHLTAFIGRERELASLKALLADDNKRLMTIVAPGGMGKTRLSLEAAAQMVGTFPQGVYFVALDRIASAELIIQSVAEVLPIVLASNEDPRYRVLDYLRDKAILLVMDNFEHVLDGSTFVQDILQAAPHVQILATSRAKLNLMGETVFNIEGLTIGEGSSGRDSAIQLFGQSARQAQPSFELNDVVLPAVTEICRLVDGMPLAIVLAAAWIDTLSVDEIADEIEKSMDVLETEKRDMPERQRSVRAVIESSWNQVDMAAQDLLKRLSVFRGGFTRAAVQEAAGASLRGLSQLVDKALVQRDPGTGRYSMHELLRQYAEEQLKLSVEEERSAHEAHAKYFADFMQACEMRLHDQRQRVALMEVDADLDNIRIAWNYWTEKQDASRLVEFIDGLFLFFEVRSSSIPAIQLLDAAAQKLASDERDIVCARAQIRAGRAWFTALIGLPEEGLRMAQESINILRQHNQDVNLQTLLGVAINAVYLNRVEILSQITQEVAARAERSGDAFERVWALEWRGYALILQHQIEQAVQTLQQGLALSKELDNPMVWSWAEALLGACSMAVGDTSAAKTYYSRGAQQAEEVNYVRMLQICYETLGTLALNEKDLEQAQQFSLRCLRISQECGQTREMLASLRDLASAYIAQGQPERALQLLAVVLNHPASEQNSLSRPERLRDEAERLRAQIESQLDHSVYQAAWESGQGQRLGDVAGALLN